MLSVEAARARVLAGLRPMAAEMVAVESAWGRVLASPVAARLTQPPEDVSAMDGYACRAADAGGGAKLRVVGAAPAGHPYGETLKWGEAVRIFTGSVIPAGADCVFLQEDAEADGEIVVAREAPREGQHIRPKGQDFHAGETVLAAGLQLGARQIGLAAAANHPWLAVHRRPRVAILATGDEIALPGDPVGPGGPGGIVSSNSLMLAAMIRAAGAEPTLLPIAGDRIEAIEQAADAAAGADLLLTTGGASVGEHDLIQAGFSKRGFALDFWKIAMRPGKPMIFGRIGDLPVLGLPGNPVSAFVCAVLFLLPALRRLSGLPDAPTATERAILGAPVKANDHRADHLRAVLTRSEDGTLVASAFARQDSGMLRLLTEAGALILRAPHAPALAGGQAVEIIRLNPGGL